MRYEISSVYKNGVGCNVIVVLQAKDKVEVDPDAIEKLMVTKADFMSALATDCKPVSVLVCYTHGSSSSYHFQSMVLCISSGADFLLVVCLFDVSWSH